MKKRREIIVNFSHDCYIFVNMYLSEFLLICRDSTTSFVKVDNFLININNIVYIEQLFEKEDFHV